MIVTKTAIQPDDFRRIGTKMRDNWIGDMTLGAVTQHIIPAWNAHVARGPRQDRLQERIVAIVRKRPKVTALELLKEFSDGDHRDVIDGIDEESGTIYFFIKDPEGDENPHREMAKVSGLKDRLYRAKKYLRANLESL